MRYKIEVKYISHSYEYSLFKKKFIFWKKIGWDKGEIPLPRKVFEWQERFKIPDNKINVYR